jgi:ATP-binding cassette subfamily A (ABC1) protein 3
MSFYDLNWKTKFLLFLAIPANIGAIVGAILWFIIFIPFAFLQPRYNVLSRMDKILWSVGTNIGICWSCQLLCKMEGTGLGAQWDSLFQGATPDDPFCLGDCVLVMIFNGVVFIILTGYIEAVWPGEFGIPQPWYFFLTVSRRDLLTIFKTPIKWECKFVMISNRFLQKWFWTGEVRQFKESNSDSNETLMSSSSRARRRDFFEEVPNNAKPGIQIKGLTKKFGESKVAVKNLYLDLYENEIFGMSKLFVYLTMISI